MIDENLIKCFICFLVCFFLIYECTARIFCFVFEYVILQIISSQWGIVRVCMRVCETERESVCVCVCVCELGGEGSRVFASRALVVV